MDSEASACPQTGVATDATVFPVQTFTRVRVWRPNGELSRVSRNRERTGLMKTLQMPRQLTKPEPNDVGELVREEAERALESLAYERRQHRGEEEG